MPTTPDQRPGFLQRLRRWTGFGGHAPAEVPVELPSEEAAPVPSEPPAEKTARPAKPRRPLKPAERLVYQPRRDFRAKMATENPYFAQRLARKPTIAGWSHNPWQTDTPDAKATDIALKYHEYFTDALAGLGYLPFMGVEVNCGVTTDSQDDPTTHVVDNIYRLLNAMNDRVAETSQFLTQRSLMGQGGAEGRIYNDCGELEIATPAQSPMATIKRANDIKRLLYEATHRFASEFAHSREGKADPNARVPASRSADVLARMIGPMDIRFTSKNGGTGEHLNFSLMKRSAKHLIDYSQDLTSKKLDKANLFTNESLRDVFAQAWMAYLPQDELLAYGNAKKFQRLNINYDTLLFDTRANSPRHQHTIYGKGIAGSVRAEIRSFHDASSNLALSSLAVVAVAYKAIKTMHERPDLRAGLQRGSKRIQAAFMDAMSEHIHPDRYIPRNLAEATERFRTQSPTLQIMREFVEDTVKSPKEKKARLAEIDAFEEAVVARAALIPKRPVAMR